MLKVLIVEDERLVGLGISEFVNEIEGFWVMDIAQDGIEAIEKIEKEEPDIVITDIRMPRMEGTELVKYLNTHYPSIRKVVLSGFDDFEYTRTAIVNGVMDYLLKPVDDQELVKVLKRLQEDIRQEAEKKEQMLRQNIKLKNSLPLLRDQFILDLMTQRYTTSEVVVEKMRYFEIEPANGQYAVVIVGINSYGLLCKKKGQDEGQLLLFIIRNITEEIVSRYTTFLSCVNGGEVVLAICVPEAEQNDSARFIKRVMLEVYQNLLEHVKEEFSIAMGTVVEGYMVLKQSYETAYAALQHRFYKKSSSLNYWDEARNKPFTRYDEVTFDGYIEKGQNIFDNSVKTGATGRLRFFLEELYTFIEGIRLYPADAIKVFTGLQTRIQIKSPDVLKAIYESYSIEYSYEKSIENFSTLEGIKSYTERFYSQIITKVIHNMRSKDKKMVEVAKDYVRKHYHEKITLDNIAAVTYLNPNYFCEMFKTQTGENFIDFLTRFRMEKAKELLRDVRMKTYEVSHRVGYENADYFCKVFKKVVGVSPGQYRNLD